jgi:hypothetical protein
MIVNKLQNGLLNLRIAPSPRASRLKCQKKNFSNGHTYFFVVILIEIFIRKTTMYHNLEES